MTLFGRSRLPDAARPHVDVAPGERVLASAELVGGGVAVATSHRLVVVGDGIAAPPDEAPPDEAQAVPAEPTPWVDGSGPQGPTATPPVPAEPPGPPGPLVTSDRWVDIAGASLDADAGVLEVELVAGPRRVLLLGPNRGRRFATATRERIQHSVLLTRTVDLDRRRAVRVVARREPGGDAFVQIVPGPGVSVEGPDVAAAVAAAERAVRDQVGLPPT